MNKRKLITSKKIVSPRLSRLSWYNRQVMEAKRSRNVSRRFYKNPEVEEGS